MPDDGIEQLFGAHDSHLRTFEELFGVRVRTDGNHLLVDGEAPAVEGLERTVRQLSALVGDGYRLSADDVRQAAQLVMQDASVRLRDYFVKTTVKASSKRQVAPKSLNQRRYLEAIDRHDVVFGVGPAGTGKTYLAMAQAVAYLTAKKVTRIILARPAVEAGERLGFLPGDMQEKVNPYLRPLYDALYDMLDLDRVDRLLDRRTIEIAPLAFMRGRTLNDAFVILDEAQNTTAEQMKMFLTRLGVRFEGGHHRRHHPDRPAGGARVGPRRGPGDPGARGRHRVHPLRRPRRGAAPARAPDRPGLRDLGRASRGAGRSPAAPGAGLRSGAMTRSTDRTMSTTTTRCATRAFRSGALTAPELR